MMRYENENERLADETPCSGLRANLKICLLESECCKKVNYIWSFQIKNIFFS